MADYRATTRRDATHGARDSRRSADDDEDDRRWRTTMRRRERETGERRKDGFARGTDDEIIIVIGRVDARDAGDENDGERPTRRGSRGEG
jgi:hypothetical protein